MFRFFFVALRQLRQGGHCPYGGHGQTEKDMVENVDMVDYMDSRAMSTKWLGSKGLNPPNKCEVKTTNSSSLILDLSFRLQVL
jgi:hypothetical protein